MAYVKLEDVLNIIRNENHNLAGLVNHIEEHCPTADVEERKHGEWKGKPIAGYSDIRCSVCHTRFVQETGTWAYCPECGAKMDGGKAE